MVAIPITQAATNFIDDMVGLPHGARQLRAGMATAEGVPGWERFVDVAELGGPLSASWFGLPTVANLPGIVAAVGDGESLTVDGDAGTAMRSM